MNPCPSARCPLGTKPCPFETRRPGHRLFAANSARANVTRQPPFCPRSDAGPCEKLGSDLVPPPFCGAALALQSGPPVGCGLEPLAIQTKSILAPRQNFDSFHSSRRVHRTACAFPRNVVSGVQPLEVDRRVPSVVPGLIFSIPTQCAADLGTT